MPNPFDDAPSDDDIDQNDLESLRQDIAKAEGNEPDTFEVGAEVEESDDLEPEEPRQSRSERRRQRGRDFGNKREEELAAAREENMRVREELAEARGRLAAQQQYQQQAPSQQPQEDPFRARQAEVSKRKAQMLKDYENAVNAKGSAGLSEEERNQWLQKSEAIDEERATIAAERVIAQQNSPERQAQDRLRAQYPDVASDPKHFGYARAVYQQRMALGKVTEANMAEEVASAMEATRKQFRIGQYKSGTPATERDRTSFGTTSRGGGSRRAGSGPKQFTFTPETESMALAYYDYKSDWSDAQKKQAYANMMSKDD